MVSRDSRLSNGEAGSYHAVDASIPVDDEIPVAVKDGIDDREKFFLVKRVGVIDNGDQKVAVRVGFELVDPAGFTDGFRRCKGGRKHHGSKKHRCNLFHDLSFLNESMMWFLMRVMLGEVVFVFMKKWGLKPCGDSFSVVWLPGLNYLFSMAVWNFVLLGNSVAAFRCCGAQQRLLFGIEQFQLN
ncbi:hypothetical protein [Burkholderia sp. F1]|uniref:hypothetical protein n=1 Tax=Burkholderia sp. F1 TaxID=3366817 RepID=UPI003D704A32